MSGSTTMLVLVADSGIMAAHCGDFQAEEQLKLVEDQRKILEERQRLEEEEKRRQKRDQEVILNKKNARPRLSFSLNAK